jgi:hypothetical protein
MVNSSKTAICVVISLLIVTLIYSSLSTKFVQLSSAKGPSLCFESPQYGFCKDRKCINVGIGEGEPPSQNKASCCWTDTNSGEKMCEVCEVNTDTGEFENCHIYSKGKPDTSTIAPPPSGVAPPPSTQTCPENTALDANGNCAPVTQGPKDQQGTKEPPTKAPSSTTDQNEEPKVKEKNKDTNSEK